MTDSDKRIADIAKIGEGKALFTATLRRFNVPEEESDALWEVAFTAGRVTEQHHTESALREMGSKMIQTVRENWPKVPAILLLLLVGCGNARAGRAPGAERVFTTEPGYTCFLIRDDEGKGVGGNCVKE